MLGAAQERWFAETLADSKRRGQSWQIVAQQVVMGEPSAPPGVSRLIPDEASAGSRVWFDIGQQMSALGLPWNLDSWGGYPAARARFLQACADHGANVIALGGDSHNCWVNNLQAPGNERLAALEFAGGSVTSPGFERTLTRATPGERESAFRSANPQLRFCDLTNRGYGVLRFTRAACEAEWLAIPDVRAAEAPAPLISRMSASASVRGGPGVWVP